MHIRFMLILDQFNNLDNMIFVDWSINVDSVVYSAVVHNVVTKTVDDTVELSMDSTSTNFQLSESDTRKFVLASFKSNLIFDPI